MQHSRGRRVMYLALLVAAAVTAGCRPCPTELLSREQLFQRYNDNAAKAPSLWAIADVEIELAKGLIRKVRLTDGRLYYLRGDGGRDYFLLRGREVGQTYFQLGVDGSTGEFFYWVRPPRGEGFARWGRLADLHKGGRESPSVDPTQLMSVLGIVPWPEDIDGPTQVILKTMDKPCAYLMSVVGRRAEWGGWYLLREEWIDRREQPCRPERIILYDRQGRGVMTAELDRYEAIATGGESAEMPTMPTDITIRWPKAQDIRGIRLRLTGQSLGEGPSRPNPKMFRRRIPRDILDARPLDAR